MGDPFRPVKNWPVIFGQLHFASYFMEIRLDLEGLKI